MKEMKKGYVAIAAVCFIICLLSVSLIAVAQTSKAEDVKAQWNQVICIILRILQFVAVGIAALVIMAAGLKYMTSEDYDAREGSKNMIVQAFVTLMIIFVCVQVVNYLVTGTNVQKFDLGSCERFFPTTTTNPATTTSNPPGSTASSSTTNPTGGSTTSTSTTTNGGPTTSNQCDLVTGDGDKEKHNRNACNMADQWQMCEKITVVPVDVCCQCLKKCCP